MVVSVTLAARRAAHGATARHREAARRDPQPGQHGRAVHRQDRHAHRGAHPARAATSTPPDATASACSSSPTSTATSRPACRARSTTRSSRTRTSTSSGWTQDRRGAVRLRAPARLGAGRRRRPARLLVVKGAPEDILAAVADYEERRRGRRGRSTRRHARGIAALHRRPRPTRASACSASRGKQVRRDHPHAVVGDETELVFVRLRRVPRPAEGERRRRRSRLLAASGVAVKIVTGDNERVTRHVCAQLGHRRPGVLTGAEHRRSSTTRRCGRGSTRVNLFCRVTPAQKSRIILALKRARPRRRLSRRRHQRRAAAARRRRRPVGRHARWTSQARPPTMILLEHDLRRAARRRARGPAHLRQHHEVHHDGHELELREHVQHGRRRAVPAVPADAAGADPAEQHALRRLRDADPDGPGRRGRDRAAARVGHARSSATSCGRVGPGQLACSTS